MVNGRTLGLRCLVLITLAVALHCSTTAGQTRPPPPVEQLALAIRDFKERLTELPAKADLASKPSTTRKDIDELRRRTANIHNSLQSFRATLDDLIKHTDTAREFAAVNVARVQAQSALTSGDKDIILAEWERLLRDTEKAREGLLVSSEKLSQLLRLLDRQDAYLQEFQALGAPANLNLALKELQSQIQEASNEVAAAAFAIKSPGT